MTFGSLFLNVYVGALSMVTGAVMGSFLNAWAWRMVHGESVAKGRSHCTACGHVLSAGDLIPVVSYFWRKGRCRYCGQKISVRYLIVELLMGLCFVTVVFTYGLTVSTLKILALCCVLLLAGLVDCDTYTIPDGCIVAGLALALVPGELSWREALLGAVIVSVPLLLIVLVADKVMGKETMGGGDIKLFCMTGAHLGPAVAVLHLLVSCLVGILFYLIAQPTGGKEPEEKGMLPFGPAIGLACWFCLLAGRPLIHWYFSLFY